MADFKLNEDEEKELELLVSNIMAYCREKAIPMFLSVAVENMDGHTVYSNAVNSPGSNNLILYDDKIREYILIANGSHEAVFKRDNIEIRMGDLVALQKAVPKPDIESLHPDTED